MTSRPSSGSPWAIQMVLKPASVPISSTRRAPESWTSSFSSLPALGATSIGRHACLEGGGHGALAGSCQGGPRPRRGSPRRRSSGRWADARTCPQCSSRPRPGGRLRARFAGFGCVRPRSRPAGIGRSPAPCPDGVFQPVQLSGELAAVARPDVRLDDEGDPAAVAAHGLGGPLHDVEDLIPLALDRGEHRIGPVGQTGLPDDPHRVGDGVVDRRLVRRTARRHVGGESSAGVRTEGATSMWWFHSLSPDSGGEMPAVRHQSFTRFRGPAAPGTRLPNPSHKSLPGSNLPRTGFALLT